MNAMDTLMIILKIAGVIMAFFIWVFTLGCIYGKIDQAKNEILNKMNEDNLQRIGHLKNIVDILEIINTQQNFDESLLIDLANKKKKKKDNTKEKEKSIDEI